MNAMRVFALALALSLPAAPAWSDTTQVAFDSGGGSGFDFWGLFRFRRKETAPAPSGAANGPVFRIVSWNMQTFGAHLKAARKTAAAAAVKQIFSDTVSKILAAQEIANDVGADALHSMLAEGNQSWTQSFEDTPDGMDNAFYVRDGVKIDCERLLFSDRSLSNHPARFAHMRVGDFDFTLVTVHLAYVKGQASSSVAELRHVLDWLREHLAKPGADPDVIITGDFNLPTAKGKPGSERSGNGSWTAVDEVINEYPMFRSGNLVALVDEQTSRSKDGAAANNYDHFILTGHLYSGAYVNGSARRMPIEMFEAIEAAAGGTKVSDHYPVSAEFRSGGAGGDGQPIKPDGAGACAL